ncbi:RagB/SusD family nutrient uptake outer membrane protein [Chitinophaga sp. GCM10012297]|uniref:RagB/SusD family nutrient uptake outer membrane protein n=1 Tax=Chitinophaga chungangae TaxID=2821488 RepID=A0ABS3Y9K7_9BACT|nr:RagB/SusD family nutrient uptake outer membrane protein [Chitinophaga chungangae]MBO9151355.1 RagB/SusD family nutrient uptake outer membrane protein [Chitinophaga chungangae]
MRNIIIFIFASLLVTACNKQIDSVRPLTKIDKEGELSSLAGIEETTIGNYVLLQGSGFNYFDVPLHDFAESRGNNVTLQNWAPVGKTTDAFFFRNSSSPTQGNSADLYRGAYQIIVSVNTTLEGIAAMESSGYSTLTETEKNRFRYAKGENLFIRALVYFNLVRVYGKPYYQSAASSPGVIVKTSSDIKDVPERGTVKEVYDFILRDLDAAAQLMKAPVAKTNAFAGTAAAWSLMSRAYLYMGGSAAAPDAAANQRAIDYADSVITQTGGKYILLQGGDYNKMFADDELGNIGRANSAANKEIIFAFDNSSRASTLGQFYHYDAIYNVGATFLPSANFKSLLAPGDARAAFLKLNPNSGFVETTKFLVLPEAWLTRAPYIYFRLAELYLNRAEAYAKLGNVAKAKENLKTIHTRAGLPAADVDNLATADVLPAVLKERRIELAFEGHNSFDYFRNGLPMTRTAADNNGTAFTIEPTDPKVILDLPKN